MSTTPPDRGGNTSRQPELFFDAHRGVFVPGDHYSSNAGLGIHWSANKKIAEVMGSHAWQEHATNGMGTHPNDRIIIHNAEVPLSSVETDKRVLEKNKVFSPDNLNNNSEEEIPLKRGATLRLKSSSSSTQKRTRTRTYRPPREMKA